MQLSNPQVPGDEMFGIPEYSEEALAQKFVERYGDQLRYVAAWDQWYCWTGKRWEQDSTLDAFDRARAICRDASREAGKRQMTLASAKTYIVAWLPHDPGRWWLRRGVGVILGMEEVERCDYLHEPLRLFWAPQDWLNADRRGAVVLDWRCHLSFWLPCNAAIKCQDERLARKVVAALMPPQPNVAVEVSHA